MTGFKLRTSGIGSDHLPTEPQPLPKVSNFLQTTALHRHSADVVCCLLENFAVVEKVKIFQYV